MNILFGMNKMPYRRVAGRSYRSGRRAEYRSSRRLAPYRRMRLGRHAARAARRPVRRARYRIRRVARRRPIRRIRGSGSYRIRGKQVAIGQGIPHFGSGTGSVRVKHREFISDVVMPGTSSSPNPRNILCPLNPGIPATFPWLSSIADNFQEWKPNGMVFEYISTSANALTGSNTALGVVVLGTEYNAAYGGWNSNPVANPFSTKQQAENAQFSVSGKPSQNLMHAVECKRRQTVLPEMYVRTGTVQSNQDPRMFDLGMFQLMALSGQNGSDYTIGELWLTYDISLLKPVQGSTNALVDHFNLQTSSISGTSYLGGASSNPGLTAVTGSTLGGSCVGGAYSSGSAGIYNFPSWCRSGSYLVIYQLTGGSTALTNALVFAAGTNLNPQSLFLGDTANNLHVTAAATATTQFACYIVQFNGQTALNQSWVGISAGTMPGSLSSAELWVIALNQPNGML